MAKYDAFGREIGEDTLAEQGWRSDAPAPPHSHEHLTPDLAAPQVEVPQVSIGDQPPVFASPPPSPPSAPIFSQRSIPPPAISIRRRRPFRGLRLLIFLGFVGYVAFRGIDGATDEVNRIVDDIKVPNLTSPEIPSPATPEEPVSPAEGLNAASLIRQRNLRPALERLEKETGGTLGYLTIRPDRIDAQVRKGGRMSIVQVTPGPSVRVIATVNSGGLDSTPFSEVRVASPERLTRVAARRLDIPVSRVDYVVMTRFDDSTRWVTYFKGGRYVIGDAAGRFERAYP